MASPKPDDPAPLRNEPRCPTCRAPSSAESEFFPFCSARCRVVDLGRWLGGEYVVSREMNEEDLDDPSLQA